MPDGVPMGGRGGFPGGSFHGGGMPGGAHFSFPGGGGGRGGMSPEEAEFIFSQFFGAGSDPFGGIGGGRGGPGIRMSMGGNPRGSLRGGGMQDPFSSFGMGGMPGGMGMGSMGTVPGMGSRRQPRRYDAIPAGTVVSLKGLVNRPDRNGDRGEVQQYDPSSGRYIVSIEDSDETMSVKPANLLQHVHLHLHGLENRPDLNGKRGTIIAWDSRKERYNVYVMDTAAVMSLKPSNVVLETGTVGQICGVQAKPELNGQWGTIKSFNADSGRYDVQLSEDKVLRLRLENVRV
jgi:hypothetical protein